MDKLELLIKLLEECKNGKNGNSNNGSNMTEADKLFIEQFNGLNLDKNDDRYEMLKNQLDSIFIGGRKKKSKKISKRRSKKSKKNKKSNKSKRRSKKSKKNI